MSNTAENFLPKSVDVDGLEDLYSPEAQTDPEQAQSEPTQEVQADPEQAQGKHQQKGIPLADAAEILNLHIDTVRKRLQKGKLAGFKSDEKYGQKWFVCTSELANLQFVDPEQAQSEPTQEAQADPVQAQSEPTQEAQADPVQAQGEPTQEAQADPVQAQGEPTQEVQADPAQLLAVIENQAHQLKAAGDVIMYMRSQLEEKDLRLKLLTDSQNQSTRWQRFINWFLGR